MLYNSKLEKQDIVFDEINIEYNFKTGINTVKLNQTFCMSPRLVFIGKIIEFKDTKDLRIHKIKSNTDKKIYYLIVEQYVKHDYNEVKQIKEQFTKRNINKVD